MMCNITLLDCSLRDGCHLNSGNFGERIIRGTLQKLVDSNVDIIEAGFFDNNIHSADSAYYSSIEEVKRILPENRGKSKFALMADYVDVNAIEPYDGTIEFFRLSFKRHRLEWALDAFEKLTAKGYKCFINPVNCNVYTDEEYSSLLHKVNKLKPYAFTIVDTFGVMRKNDLTHKYQLVEEILDTSIAIGVHFHENLGLSYTLAQHLLEIAQPTRNINIDGSLLGIGRVPGNLCIEQIMDHLNSQYDKSYSIDAAYDAIDAYIAPIKKLIPWGYSIPYALSGRYGIHRTYAEYLIKKNRLKTKDVQRILSQIDKNHMETFDEQYIETLYRQYMRVEYDDTMDIANFTEEICNKNILVLCPGYSINDRERDIKELAKEKDTLVISINFVPEFLKPNYIFCANKKRVDNIRQENKSKIIVTSNLIGEMRECADYIISFNDCVYFDDMFCEDSTLMALKLLSKCGCGHINIAGFDGFDNNNKYYRQDYSYEEGNDISSEYVKRIIKTSLNSLELEYITPSQYK